MDATREAKDHLGRTVRVGDRVRILGLSHDFLNSLSVDELEEIRQMIGGVFEVEEVDQWGQAWVTKWWDAGDGDLDAHGIGLSSSEMEVVP